MKAVFSLSGFKRLLMAYTVNELAWSVGNLALSLLVYRRTGSALASSAYFLVAQFFPAFVSPNVVAWVDRRDARRVLSVLYGLQALVFLILAAAPARLPLIPVLAAVFLGGSFGLTARPILRSTTARVISPPGLLREGSAVINGAFALSILMGPSIGGVLVLAGGFRLALLLDAVLFLSIILTLGRTTGPSRTVDERGGSRVRVSAAFARARQDPVVGRVLMVQGVAVVFFSMSVPVEVVLAQRALHAGPAGYAGLLSAWGSGAILGSVGYARWRAHTGWRLIAAGSILIGLGLLLMAVAPTILLAIIGSAVGGVGNGIEAVAERTALQERVEERWTALILSLNDSMSQVLPGLGFLVGGAFAALAGPRLAFFVSGVGAVAVGLLAPLFLRPAESSPITYGSAFATNRVTEPRLAAED